MTRRPAAEIGFACVFALATACATSPLLTALERYQLTEARQLIEQGADIHARDGDGDTALHKVASLGDVQLARILLERGADVNAKSFPSRSVMHGSSTPLFSAARNGSLDVVKLLLEHGATIDAKDDDGWTPLIAAAHYGQHSVAKLLLERGANLNAANKHGATALHRAAGANRAQLVALLLEAGANIELRDKHDRTPAAEAVRRKAADAHALFEDHARKVAAAKAKRDQPAVLSREEPSVRVTHLVSREELTAASIRKVAVPRMSGSGVEAHFVDILSQTATEQASRSRALQVIGASDIDAMLGFERQKDLLGCDDVSCVAEIAGALGVDAVLALSLGKIGNTYTVAATLINIRTARPLMRGAARMRGEPDGLLSVIEDVVRSVMAEL